MKANEIYVVNGKQIGTHSKAVFHENENTVFDEIETIKANMGKVTGTNVNFISEAFFLVNDMIFLKDNATNDITVKLNTKLTLNRIMAVSYSNGGTSAIAFQDGTVIPDGYALIWNAVTGFQNRAYSTGMRVDYNEVLVGLNWGGRITAGILKDIWDRYNKYTNTTLFDRTYNIKMKEYSTVYPGGTLHSMFICGDELITLECYSNGFSGKCFVYSLNDLTYKSYFNSMLLDKNSDGSQVNLRLVTCDYSEDSDALIMGNGTADGSEEGMYGYIFYDAKNWKNYTETVTLDNTPYTKLDFFTEGLFPGETTAKIVWSELSDIVYLTTTNLKYCHKLLLGVGTNKLEHGVYSYDVNKRYNGTYKILKTYKQETPEVGNKDVQFYNGCFYYPVKFVTNGYRVYKTYLNPDGSIKSDLILYDPPNNITGDPAITGSPEGIVITKDGRLICAHAIYPKFYEYNINNL